MAAVRQGSRWLHEPPTEDEVKQWFETQQLHPGMSHGPYMGGIVLIGATEKVRVTREKQNGDTYIAESEQVVFVPYVKVDTRIAYFWDYVRSLNDGNASGDFVGIIEPVPQQRWDDPNSGYFNANLPEGFGVYIVRNANNSVNRYLTCTMRVAIYRREDLTAEVEEVERTDWHAPPYSQRDQRTAVHRKAVPILQGTGSKQTAMARQWADDNAVMKAETGAIGRALGVAGILVVGTGVATAEDMQEALAGPVGAGGSTAEGAALPADQEAPGGSPDAAGPDEPTEPPQAEGIEPMRARVLALQKELESDFPDAWQAYLAWWKERGFQGLDTLNEPALRGALIKLERDLDAAKQAAAGATA